MKNMRKFIVLTMVCAALAACGVKPGTVDPPPGAEGSGFPHTYPDPETDPGAVKNRE